MKSCPYGYIVPTEFFNRGAEECPYHSSVTYFEKNVESLQAIKEFVEFVDKNSIASIAFNSAYDKLKSVLK